MFNFCSRWDGSDQLCILSNPTLVVLLLKDDTYKMGSFNIIWSIHDFNWNCNCDGGGYFKLCNILDDISNNAIFSLIPCWKGQPVSWCYTYLISCSWLHPPTATLGMKTAHGFWGGIHLPGQSRYWAHSTQITGPGPTGQASLPSWPEWPVRGRAGEWSGSTGCILGNSATHTQTELDKSS